MLKVFSKRILGSSTSSISRPEPYSQNQLLTIDEQLLRDFKNDFVRQCNALRRGKDLNPLRLSRRLSTKAKKLAQLGAFKLITEGTNALLPLQLPRTTIVKTYYIPADMTISGKVQN